MESTKMIAPKTNAQTYNVNLEAENYDSFLYLFLISRNLLVHFGVHSALAAVSVPSSKGTVYHANELKPYINNHDFIWFATNDLRDVNRESFGKFPSAFKRQWRQLAKVSRHTC